MSMTSIKLPLWLRLVMIAGVAILRQAQVSLATGTILVP